MRPADRIITELPLRELFDEHGPVKAVRQRDLLADDIRDLMRAGSVQFVVAICGSKPIWVALAEQYAFWKSEVLPRLANRAERVELDKFPDGMCYFASEWRRSDGMPVVLLEVAH
jgi:hypothetical protein